MQHLSEGVIWGILLLVAGLLLLIDTVAGVEIVFDVFVGIQLLVGGALVLLLALDGRGRR